VAATEASGDAHLREQARAVLEGNHRAHYTVPAEGLYPYQWCWDSGPIALGWAALGELDRAWDELESLLGAQWESGMIPHIVFWEPGDDYFPGPAVWRTGRRPATTGITQPPLPITAAARVFTSDPDRRRAEERMRRCWPRLVDWLHWIERARTGPHGASVIVHPWESGMDNAPSWDEPLDAVPEATDVHLERRDVGTVAAAQRPTDRQYRQFVGIVATLRDHGWDTERQVVDGPFAVEDVAFTAIAARAAADLAAVAPALDVDPDPLDAIAGRLRAGVAALWDEELEWFLPRDVVTGRSLGPRSIGGLTALWGGAATTEQAERLARRVRSWSEEGALRYGVPTCDPGSEAFDAERYWRGPVWVLTNWLTADGLAGSGHRDLAEEIRCWTLELVRRSGFSEYYDPRTGAGVGGRGFSWSAALALAWLPDSADA
jgi:hypothetical protein